MCRGGGGEGWGKREGDIGKWEITSPVPGTDVLWTASTAREVCMCSVRARLVNEYQKSHVSCGIKTVDT